MPDIGDMKEFYKDTPKPIIALQSNDYIELSEHENCVESCVQLAEKNEIKDILYQGERDFGYYKRFMIIGTW
jgi:7-keto-8-aminopelargonate synthetase-like enzyme